MEKDDLEIGIHEHTQKDQRGISPPAPEKLPQNAAGGGPDHGAHHGAVAQKCGDEAVVLIGPFLHKLARNGNGIQLKALTLQVNAAGQANVDIFDQIVGVMVIPENHAQAEQHQPNRGEAEKQAQGLGAAQLLQGQQLGQHQQGKGGAQHHLQAAHIRAEIVEKLDGQQRPKIDPAPAFSTQNHPAAYDAHQKSTQRIGMGEAKIPALAVSIHPEGIFQKAGKA